MATDKLASWANIEEQDREARRSQVLECVSKGMQYKKIAALLNVSVGTVAGDMRFLMENRRQLQVDVVESVKHSQLERIDRLIEVWMPMALQGQEKALDRVLALEERRGKLVGLEQELNAPRQSVTESGPLFYIPDNGRGPTPPALPPSEVLDLRPTDQPLLLGFDQASAEVSESG